MHTVKEAALITGLTEHAVRYYTDKGLVPSVQRNQNNIRLFDEESINWLHGVRCLKQSGMPIEVIKIYIDLCLKGDSTLPQRSELMMKHKEAALIKLEEAKQHIAHLEQKLPYIRTFWSMVYQIRPIPATGPKFSICMLTCCTPRCPEGVRCSERTDLHNIVVFEENSKSEEKQT